MLATIITLIHLSALSQIESGDRDAAVGPDGEVTRYQVLPAAARREVRENAECRRRNAEFKKRGWERDPELSRLIARGIWEKRAATFRVAHRRPPTLPELYLLWHRPRRVLAPLRRELERATRFQNMVEALTKTQDQIGHIGHIGPGRTVGRALSQHPRGDRCRDAVAERNGEQRRLTQATL